MCATADFRLERTPRQHVQSRSVIDRPEEAEHDVPVCVVERCARSCNEMTVLGVIGPIVVIVWVLGQV